MPIVQLKDINRDQSDLIFLGRVVQQENRRHGLDRWQELHNEVCNFVTRVREAISINYRHSLCPFINATRQIVTGELVNFLDTPRRGAHFKIIESFTFPDQVFFSQANLQIEEIRALLLHQFETFGISLDYFEVAKLDNIARQTQFRIRDVRNFDFISLDDMGRVTPENNRTSSIGRTLTGAVDRNGDYYSPLSISVRAFATDTGDLIRLLGERRKNKNGRSRQEFEEKVKDLVKPLTRKVRKF